MHRGVPCWLGPGRRGSRKFPGWHADGSRVSAPRRGSSGKSHKETDMGRRPDLMSLTAEQQRDLAHQIMDFLNDDVIMGHSGIDHVHTFFIDHRGYIQLLEE